MRGPNIGERAMERPLIETPDSPPESGDIEDHVRKRLFQETVDSLEGHVNRKKAISDSLRYSILFLLYEFRRLPRKKLVDATGKKSNALQHHLRELLNTNLIAEVPTPNDEDGRFTHYQVTTLGDHEIEADIYNIKGNLPDRSAPLDKNWDDPVQEGLRNEARGSQTESKAQMGAGVGSSPTNERGWAGS